MSAPLCSETQETIRLLLTSSFLLYTAVPRIKFQLFTCPAFSNWRTAKKPRPLLCLWLCFQICGFLCVKQPSQVGTKTGTRLCRRNNISEVCQSVCQAGCWQDERLWVMAEGEGGQLCLSVQGVSVSSCTHKGKGKYCTCCASPAAPSATQSAVKVCGHRFCCC